MLGHRLTTIVDCLWLGLLVQLVAGRQAGISSGQPQPPPLDLEPAAASAVTATGTIRVGKSAAAQAATISAGVALVPLGQDRRWIIDVEPGVYRERVWVNASIGPLTMRGLSASEDAVLLIYHCCPAGDGTPGCSNANGRQDVCAAARRRRHEPRS